MTELTELTGLAELARVVEPVAQRFVDAGHRIYLVGGIVRDLVLADPNTQPSDIDLTTDALPADIKALVGPLAEALWAQGERFGTIGATIDGRALEITTHRAEAYDPTSRKPMVSFGQDLDEDLSRRDFTINAMAIELPALTMHDPYGGVDDLKARLLRTPLSPDISFTDDPLRIMRAARFIARFHLTPSPELAAAANSLADRLSIVSVERVADELERLLAVTNPRSGLQFLADNHALPVELHGADLALSVELATAEPVSTELATTELAATKLATTEQTAADYPLLRRAGLLWPLGGRADNVLKRLRYSRADTIRTRQLIASTAEALASTTIEAKTIRTIAARVGLEDLPLVVSLATHVAEHDPRFEPTQGPAFAAATSDLVQREDLSDMGSPLAGRAVIETLGIEPGPMIGAAQKFLISKRLELGPLTESQAVELLRGWQSEQ